MTDTLDAAPAWVKRWGTHPAIPWALLLALAVWLSVLHLVPRGVIEHDGYFHARFSQMLPERRLSQEFPWTQESTWKDRFCDKEFLFHAYLVPFTRDVAEPINGAKLAMVILDLGIFIALYFVLKKSGVPVPWLFCLLLFCMGGSFWLRLTMIRSHVLSILLFVIGLYFLCKNNLRGLLVLGFVYSWSYTAPYVLVMAAIPFWLGTKFAKSETPWKWTLVASAAFGVLLGLAIHPYSPLTLETFLTYLNVMRMGIEGKQRTSIELASEMYSFGWSFVVFYPMLVLGHVVLIWMNVKWFRKLTSETLGFWAISILWLVLMTLVLRMAEYAVPSFVIAFAFVSRDLWPGWPAFQDWRTRRPLLSFAILLMLVLQFLMYGISSHARVLELMQAEPPAKFSGAAAWMEKELKPSETVVNLFWDDFPELYYSAYRQHYLVGLDPTYMLRHDEAKALALEEMRSGRVPLNREKLAKLFGARYMILRREVLDKFKELKTASNGWKPVYEDPQALIYSLEVSTPLEPAP